MKTFSGLDRLLADRTIQQRIKGNIGYLCHNASVDARCREGLAEVFRLFGPRLKAVFSPQHGLFSEAQDNMIESDHFVHPYFQVPVYSLYSETRKPTPAMLDGLDFILVDLQDIGCRAYTFVYTMILLMEACAESGTEVVVLDRPNPLGGQVVEGIILEPGFRSFIGLYPLPMRHGLTIGEMARMATLFWGIDCRLSVVALHDWDRAFYFGQTELPWVFPSPNMPHIKTAQVFPATVLLEGTNLSEGRGTTRPFEIFGHPALRPHAWLDPLARTFGAAGLEGFTLRPLYFQPTFDKWMGVTCGGYQLHVTDRRLFRPWAVGLVLLRELRNLLGDAFQWRQPPFEYEERLLPIDMLNGTDRLRHWIETNGSADALAAMAQEGRPEFLARKEAVRLY